MLPKQLSAGTSLLTLTDGDGERDFGDFMVRDDEVFSLDFRLDQMFWHKALAQSAAKDDLGILSQFGRGRLAFGFR